MVLKFLAWQDLALSACKIPQEVILSSSTSFPRFHMCSPCHWALNIVNFAVRFYDPLEETRGLAKDSSIVSSDDCTHPPPRAEGECNAIPDMPDHTLLYTSLLC